MWCFLQILKRTFETRFLLQEMLAKYGGDFLGLRIVGTFVNYYIRLNPNFDRMSGLISTRKFLKNFLMIF